MKLNWKSDILFSITLIVIVGFYGPHCIKCMRSPSPLENERRSGRRLVFSSSFFLVLYPFSQRNFSLFIRCQEMKTTDCVNYPKVGEHNTCQLGHGKKRSEFCILRDFQKWAFLLKKMFMDKILLEGQNFANLLCVYEYFEKGVVYDLIALL